MSMPLRIALPKGRLQKDVLGLFQQAGMPLEFADRSLIAHDPTGRLDAMLVKNSDLPVYVHHGIAGLGICGEDTLYESGFEFVRLMRLPFGSTRICLAEPETPSDQAPARSGGFTVATTLVRFTRDYYHARGIPVNVIRLSGSVELAPRLGLAPYIVDLVESGATLTANKLRILEDLDTVSVFLVANPAYYKLNFRRVDELCGMLASHAAPEFGTKHARSEQQNRHTPNPRNAEREATSTSAEGLNAAEGANAKDTRALHPSADTRRRTGRPRGTRHANRQEMERHNGQTDT